MRACPGCGDELVQCADGSVRCERCGFVAQRGDDRRTSERSNQVNVWLTLAGAFIYLVFVLGLAGLIEWLPVSGAAKAALWTLLAAGLLGIRLYRGRSDIG